MTDQALDVCPVGALLRKRVGFAVPVGQRLYDKVPIGGVPVAPEVPVSEEGRA